MRSELGVRTDKSLAMQDAIPTLRGREASAFRTKRHASVAVAGKVHFEEYGRERQTTAFLGVPRATKSNPLFLPLSILFV
jgi:hypothetical protein